MSDTEAVSDGKWHYMMWDGKDSAELYSFLTSSYSGLINERLSSLAAYLIHIERCGFDSSGPQKN
jgi:hypothetical protein